MAGRRARIGPTAIPARITVAASTAKRQARPPVTTVSARPAITPAAEHGVKRRKAAGRAADRRSARRACRHRHGRGRSRAAWRRARLHHDLAFGLPNHWITLGAIRPAAAAAAPANRAPAEIDREHAEDGPHAGRPPGSSNRRDRSRRNRCREEVWELPDDASLLRLWMKNPMTAAACGQCDARTEKRSRAKLGTEAITGSAADSAALRDLNAR